MNLGGLLLYASLKQFQIVSNSLNTTRCYHFLKLFFFVINFEYITNTLKNIHHAGARSKDAQRATCSRFSR